jgi:hypothetical protein
MANPPERILLFLYKRQTTEVFSRSVFSEIDDQTGSELQQPGEGSQFSRAAACSAGRSILIIPIMASMALG